MEIPIYQIDAFTSRLFAGNPAAVCPLKNWLDDRTLLNIARENNLSETAFFVRDGSRYRLRWFTPAIEVDLCGHATLASAYVIFNFIDPDAEAVAFETKSGTLTVRRRGDLLAMDFPARPASKCAIPHELSQALGKAPRELFESRDYMAVFDTEDEVRALKPDMALLSAVGHFAVIATAPGDNSDFVSRFFGPAVGVPEDPVTGSAHSTLVPYWAKRLSKSSLHAFQVSERGGELWCEDCGERVVIAGRAVKYLEGRISL